MGRDTNINQVAINYLKIKDGESNSIISTTNVNLSAACKSYVEKQVNKIFNNKKIRYAKQIPHSTIDRTVQSYFDGKMEVFELGEVITNKLIDTFSNYEVEDRSEIIIVDGFNNEKGNFIAVLKVNFVIAINHKKEKENEITIKESYFNLNTGQIKNAIIFLQRPQKTQNNKEYSILFITSLKDIKEKEVTTNLFEMIFECNEIFGERQNTQKLIEKTEKTIRNLRSGSAVEALECRKKLKEELMNNDKINIYNFADKIFNDEKDKEVFHESIQESEIPENVFIDRFYVSDNFKKIKLNIQGGIEIKIPETSYNDINVVEFKKNDDGTINIIIKDIGKYNEST